MIEFEFSFERGGFREFALAQLSPWFQVEFGWWADNLGASLTIEVPAETAEEVLSDLTALDEPVPQVSTLADFGLDRAVERHDHDRTQLPDIAPDELVLAEIERCEDGIALGFGVPYDDDCGAVVVISCVRPADENNLLVRN